MESLSDGLRGVRKRRRRWFFRVLIFPVGALSRNDVRIENAVGAEFAPVSSVRVGTAVPFSFLFALCVPLAHAQDRAVSQPAESFEELSRVLAAGDQIVVTDENGRASRGKIISISDDQLGVLVRFSKGFFERVKERAFHKEKIRRIDAVDSKWNGALIGVGGGLALTAFVAVIQPAGHLNRVGTWVILGPVLGATGGVVGALLDEESNEAVYQRPAHAALTVAPIFPHQGIGFVAQVRF